MVRSRLPQLAPLLAITGCLPGRIHLAVPAWTTLPGPAPSGPTVALAYPIDVRPPGERRETPHYTSTFNNFPLATYGDAALVPGPLEAIDATLRASLSATGIPSAPWDDADFRVRVFVLHHVGRRDISDANWVSTVSGGLAGTVGQFATPTFAVVEARLRLEVTDRSGTSVEVRDVRAFRVERRSVAATWGIWSLFLRTPAREMFEQDFREVEADLGRDAALVVDQARKGTGVVAGVSADETAWHSLDRWRPPDSLTPQGAVDPWDTAMAMSKYGSKRFSVASGYIAHPGDVVGRIGVEVSAAAGSVPLAGNFGYDIALSGRTQLLVDLSVLGGLTLDTDAATEGRLAVRTGAVDDRVGLGARLLAARSHHRSLVFEPRYAAEFSLFDVDSAGEVDGFGPRLSGSALSLEAVAAVRPGEFTAFARCGSIYLERWHPVPGSALFPSLTDGAAWALELGPGGEVQLGPTIALSAEVLARAWWEDGSLRPGVIGPLELSPRLVLGLR